MNVKNKTTNYLQQMSLQQIPTADRFHKTLLSHTTPHYCNTTPHCTAAHHTTTHRTSLQNITLHFITPNKITHHTGMHYTPQYHTAFHHTLLHYTALNHHLRTPWNKAPGTFPEYHRYVDRPASR